MGGVSCETAFHSPLEERLWDRNSWEERSGGRTGEGEGAPWERPAGGGIVAEGARMWYERKTVFF